MLLTFAAWRSTGNDCYFCLALHSFGFVLHPVFCQAVCYASLRLIKISSKNIWIVYTMYISLHSKTNYMQVHSILAVQKLGLDYSWFNLITTRSQKFTVYDNGISWVIDETNKEAEITINQFDDYGQIEQCTIYGTRQQINNLMHSIGLSVPEIVSDSVYMATIIELKNKLDYLISEVNELKNAQETTA